MKPKHRNEPNGTYPLEESSNYHTCNNGFWDRDPQERAARMDAACERGGVTNFFDLPPEERAQCYDAE